MSNLSNLDKKEILLEFNSQKHELNRMISNWDLIPGALLNEFDHLTNQILSQLWKGVDRSKIQRIIQSEIITRYGIDCEEEESEIFSSEIYNWWLNGKQVL